MVVNNDGMGKILSFSIDTFTSERELHVGPNATIDGAEV